MKRNTRGFTIVELLIVIIVVGILASISVVAYRGSQDRAEYAKAQTDLKHINDALIIYKAQNARYPVSNNTAYDYEWQHYGTVNNNFLSALVPNYLDKMPIGKSGGKYSSYVYSSDGLSYKLLRLGNGALPSVELTSDPSKVDNLRAGYSWGYWGGACDANNC